MFYTQMRTRNKTVRNYQFGNKAFHEKVRTRNKTILNIMLSKPFGNSMFHTQIATRNKTVPNYQPENNVFHAKIRNSRVFFVDYIWQNSPTLSLYTDASGALGCGAIFGSRWCYEKWLGLSQYCYFGVLSNCFKSVPVGK